MPIHERSTRSSRLAMQARGRHDEYPQRHLHHTAVRGEGSWYTALKEQVVAELATDKRKEPRVDVDAWGLVAEPRILLDATVT